MDIITYAICKKYVDNIVKDLAGALKYKGSKEKVSDLPAPSASIKGHVYTISGVDQPEYGHEFVCDGTQWIDLSADLNNKQDKLIAGENITIAADGKTISAQQPDISGKVDKPNEPVIGQGINVPYYFDVEYTDSKAIVNDYTVDLLNKDKAPQKYSLEISAASEEKAGLMTAADKVKLNAAITEHQDISGKQDKLTAGDGIAIDTDNKISANVRTYKPFPSSWPHSTGTTIASFCAAVNASYKSGEIKIGDAFLGNVNSTAFFSGAYLENGGSLESAEVSVQIMNPFGQNCVQLLTTTSSNNAPYHWEYTYVDGAASEGWRCWSQHSYVEEKLSSKQDTLSAGTNIDITNNTISVKIDSISLSGIVADGAWHDGGTLSQEQANILLASELNYIWLNNMHRLDFKYKDTDNNLATYAATDGEKSHLVEIVLYGKGEKTWRYKHITEAPDEDGTYVWKCVVSGGVKTYKWVKEN